MRLPIVLLTLLVSTASAISPEQARAEEPAVSPEGEPAEDDAQPPEPLAPTAKDKLDEAVLNY